MKTCELHPLAERYKYKCIECHRKNARDWNAKNKDLVNERNKKYAIENKEKIANRKKNHYEKYKQTHLDRARAYAMKSKYGLTIEDYKDMHQKQNGLCLICGKPETQKSNPKSEKPDSLRVDHCHTTGKIRGLLCSACNFGISKFRDDPLLMLRAAAYVEGWQDELFSEIVKEKLNDN